MFKKIIGSLALMGVALSMAAQNYYEFQGKKVVKKENRRVHDHTVGAKTIEGDQNVVQVVFSDGSYVLEYAYLNSYIDENMQVMANLGKKLILY